MNSYTLGIDFGTLSGRAVLVDTLDGREVASAVVDYPHGVIREALPGSAERLPLEWALQHPLDYLGVLRQTIPAVLRKSGVKADEVVGLGLDFTSCTMLPTKTDGTPLMALDAWKAEPHAWVKLWKRGSRSLRLSPKIRRCTTVYTVIINICTTLSGAVRTA